MRQDNAGYLTSGESDATGRQAFGWVEKDGDLGDNTGPTSPEESVYVGNVLEPGVVVNLNPCYRWSRRLFIHSFILISNKGPNSH